MSVPAHQPGQSKQSPGRGRRLALQLAAALAVPLALLAFFPAPARAQAVFTDVPPADWAAPAILALADAGVISGYPDGSFRPDGPVSRAEFTALVIRLVLGREAAGGATTGPFADVPPSHWAAADIATAAARGWIAFPLTAARAFGPDRPTDREEAVSLLGAAFLGAGQSGAGQATPAVGPWSDAGQVAPWARAAFAAAMAAGIVGGYPDGTLRPEAPLTRAQAAALIYRARQQLLVVGDRRFHILRKLDLTATTYGRAERGIGATTATGTPVRVGEAAVDPAVIPLGSYLWVWGYETPYLPPGGILEHAEDTGGLVKGPRIDLYMDAPTAQAYTDFGVQRVQAYLLAPLH